VQHARDGIRVNSVHPGVMPPMRGSTVTSDPVSLARMLALSLADRRPGSAWRRVTTGSGGEPEVRHAATRMRSAAPTSTA
jgi:hypothetical protein